MDSGIGSPRRLLIVALAVTTAGMAAQSQNAPPAGEPTNAEEAALQEKYDGKITPEAYRAYRALVDTLPADEAKWERVLESQLGAFYFPIHLNSRIKPTFNPENSEWGFLRGDPALPRVLLIGDSISRSYTVGVRRELAGKAVVHRAPANCGPTDSGLRHLDVWLDQGTGKWDVILFNFGIHDRRKTAEQYVENLEKIIARLRQTGATLIWARITPFGDRLLEGEDESVPLNQAGDAVITRHGIPMADLHAAVFARVATLQAADQVHFNSDGIKIMAAAAAAAIRAQLKTP